MMGEVPSKINFFVFVWAVLRGRTLTTDNLRKGRKTFISRRVMCQRQEETIQHLFLDCPITQGNWKSLTEGFTYNLSGATSLNGCTRERKAMRLSIIGRKVWRVLVDAITWGLWRECNNCIFEDIFQASQHLLNSVKLIMWDFIKFDVITRGARVEQFIFN